MSESLSVKATNASMSFTKLFSIILAIGTAGYFLPWAIAVSRDVKHVSVFWYNFFAAPTFGITWVVALVLACKTQEFTITKTVELA